MLSVLFTKVERGAFVRERQRHRAAFRQVQAGLLRQAEVECEVENHARLALVSQHQRGGGLSSS